jgi:outer membrane protein assembly factor BamB
VAFGDELVFLKFGQVLMVFERVPSVECPVYGSPLCDPLWTLDLGSEGMTPVVSADGGTVYIGNRQGQVRVLDAVDGTERWSASLGPVGAPGLSAAPTLGDGWLYVPSSDGRVYVFDADGCGAATCSAVWVGATGSPVRRQAALAGGVLYVASEDGSIDAYDGAGCNSILCVPLWSGSTGSAITGGPVVALGHLLVGTADGRLIAYRPG